MNDKSKQSTAKTIIVADDQLVVREMVRAILKSIGYENVLSAENGVSAIRLISDNDVDLVICDWNMPVLSGIEVLRKVRSDERYKSLPFLMLTAEVNRENVTEAIDLGVSDYVAKPFTAEILTSKIIKLLKPRSRG